MLNQLSIRMHAERIVENDKILDGKKYQHQPTAGLTLREPDGRTNLLNYNILCDIFLK